MKGGVRQGRLLSLLIFLIVLDGVMRRVNRVPTGVQWGMVITTLLANRGGLEDIDFTDDNRVICGTYNDMVEKLSACLKKATNIT